MNFDFSEEEAAVKDQARRFLTEQALLPLVRTMLDGGGGQSAASLWDEVARLGWAGTAIPEAYGGAGMGHVALCALAEEVGRACAPLPLFASIYLAAESLMLAGSETQKQNFLPQLASGTLIGTALLETGAAGCAPARVVSGRISGQMLPVPHGMQAGMIVVAAEEDGEPGLFVVELDQPRIERRPLAVIDESRPHAALHLDRAQADRLGAPGCGDGLARRIEARAAVLTGFEQLGGADAAFEMALSYAKERRSFGRVIGSYQAIKHKLADMYVKNQLARSNAYYAAWALSAGNESKLELAAATTRVAATEAFEYASAENIELHGGMGYTWAADPHLYYRRSRLLALALGSSDSWCRRLARALAKDAASAAA